ncbi:tyrosine-type recombinase/integrase [Sinorhizobium medicae]|uniref:tyrosine-type recombinase/integrase n=1 Tax=Sinorhizobium medicae TaxID=110321 RepID=UPI0027DCDEC4|nr:tyrosine-type recombinase/integrase [Sinorhizobium medicae]
MGGRSARDRCNRRNDAGRHPRSSRPAAARHHGHSQRRVTRHSASRCRLAYWRTGEVFVRRTKGKRDRVVPLLEETGAALADYILRARPRVDSPYLFLSFTPPVGPFKCAAPVSRIVRKRLRHGGVELGRVAGAHLLRHSLATQLVGQRRPINEVADLLGHRSINTTALYVKVAASQLAEVALPFPGGVA